jgi:DNA polymerase elongation subunit (family B)
MELVAHPYDWCVREEEEGKIKKMRIHCWCLTRESEACLLIIDGWAYSCYLELPLIVKGTTNWTDGYVKEVVDTLIKLTSTRPIFWQLVKKKKLYYYTGDRTYPMVMLSFATYRDMKAWDLATRDDPVKVGNLGYLPLRLWESDIGPVRKLLTLKGLGFSQWFRCKCTLVTDDERISICRLEAKANWNDIRPIQPDESSSWSTVPRILAFDIECYSSNHRALPNMYNVEDVVYMISCIFQVYRDRSTRKRYCLVYGDCKDIDGVEVIRVDKETELAVRFADLIQELQPDIISGYNILSFDYWYLDYRTTKRLGKWKPLGRLMGELPILESKSWASSAYSHNDNHILTMSGRVSVDMHRVISRDHKLGNNDLNTVSLHFLGRGKHDVKPAEMFAIYEAHKRGEPNSRDEMTKVAAYCVEDSELVIDLFEHLDTWPTLTEMSSVCGVTISQLTTRGMQLRVMSLLYDIAWKNHVVIDERSAPPQYVTGAAIIDPIPGIYDNCIVLDFASLYPSIIIAMNLCYTTLIHPDVDVADSECNVIEPEQEENSVVCKYRHRWYKRKKGIFPQMLEQLLSERRAVRAKLEVTKDKTQKLLLDKRQNALKIMANSGYGFFGVKKDGKKPLQEAAMDVTFMGRTLIGEVNKYLVGKYGAKIVYGDTDSTMISLGIVNSRLCNYLGTRLSHEISGVKAGDKRPFLPEELIEEARIYGEVSRADYYEHDRPGLFPPPLAMAYEKSLRILCIKKKMYIGWYIGKDGEFRMKNGKPDILEKGVAPVRRDRPHILRETYRYLESIIMEKKEAGYMEAMEYVAQRVITIKNGVGDGLSYKDFLVTKTVGKKYDKKSNFPMKLFSEALHDRGIPVKPGDKLTYLVLVGSGTEKHLGQRMCLEETWLDTGRPPIDYFYYLENVMANPIDLLMRTAFSSVMPTAEECADLFNDKVPRFDRPVAMYAHYLRANPTHDEHNDGRILRELRRIMEKRAGYVRKERYPGKDT